MKIPFTKIVICKEGDPVPTGKEKPDKLAKPVAYIASFCVLATFIVSDPALIVYNWSHEGSAAKYNEHWFSTLLNLTLLAFGVLIGKQVQEQHNIKEREHERQQQADNCPTCGQPFPKGQVNTNELDMS